MDTSVHMDSESCLVSVPLFSNLQELEEHQSNFNHCLQKKNWVILRTRAERKHHLELCDNPGSQSIGPTWPFKKEEKKVFLYMKDKPYEWQYETLHRSHLLSMFSFCFLSFCVLLCSFFLALYLHIIICAYAFINCKTKRRTAMRRNVKDYRPGEGEKVLWNCHSHR